MAMVKLKKEYKVVLLATGAVVVLLPILFLLRGVWRSNILPAYTLALHKADLDNALRKETDSVNYALHPLGLQLDTKQATTCSLDIAIRWSTSISCWAEIDTSKVTALPNKVTPEVLEAKKTMEAQGWQGNIGDPAGIFLSFDKKIKGFDCGTQVWNGYNRDKIASARLFCSDTYYYFGNPYTRL